MVDKSRCPLCRQPFETTKVFPGQAFGLLSEGEHATIKCVRCGRYKITKRAYDALQATDRLPRLCSLARRAYEGGRDWLVTPEMVDAERQRQAPDVAERQRLILEFLAGKSTSPGASVSVESSVTWPVGDCNNEGEFDWHLRELDRKGLIKFRSMTQRADAELTSEGWAALARDSGERVDPHRAFVAMSFATDLQPVWELGFKLAIESAGYDAHRADSQPSTEAIDQKLIGDIRRSRFVIADVTHHRPNVYFEAGYALAMGKPVIWTVQEDHKEDLHFDTRQFPHLVWKDAAHLAEQLENFVAGAIGRLERPDRRPVSPHTVS